MEEQEGKDKQPVQAVKSRPGTLGLSSKLNSFPKDDVIKSDEEEDEPKKSSPSRSTLERLLQEEENRQKALARESTGSVIYDYDETLNIPYAVESSSTSEDISQLDAIEEQSQDVDASKTTENATEATGDTTKVVVEQTSDEGNQMSYSSESYTLDVSNEGDEYEDVTDQSDAAVALTDDVGLFNSKLSETKNSLEILQNALTSTEKPADDAVEIVDDTDSAQDSVAKKRIGGFLRKLFSGGKKKTSE